LISDFPMYRSLPSANRDNLPVASAAALQVLCLPIYPALQDAQVAAIAELIGAWATTEVKTEDRVEAMA
jgi:dTDP-4-amino-4,6-dideoxygalactose transaminase